MYIRIIWIFLSLTVLVGTQTASAQIYADLTLAQGSTSLGTARVLLYHDKAPRTVANFIGLATGQRNWIDISTGRVQVGRPFYDGLTFHRLIHNFMIQGGDPLGNGMGGPGYKFQDEFHPTLSHDSEYLLSMANSGVNTNGSQFFITLSTPTYLDFKHSIFGKVIDDATYPNSRALIDGFKDATAFPTAGQDLPITPIIITSIAFSGPDYASFDIHDPAHKLPIVNPQPITLSHDPAIPQFDLNWDTDPKYDYLIYNSNDLSTWNLAGNLLSMDDNPDYQININGLATTSKGFYTVTKIDYGDVPIAPQNVLADGNSLTLNSNGGSLILNFNTNGGTWSFVYTDTSITPESGNLGNLGQETSTYPIIPTTGVYLNTSDSYARLLSLREVIIFLDGTAGPDLLTAVQPLLSFHTDTTGWFEGPVNTNSTSPVTFKGSFALTQ